MGSEILHFEHLASRLLHEVDSRFVRRDPVHPVVHSITLNVRCSNFDYVHNMRRFNEDDIILREGETFSETAWSKFPARWNGTHQCRFLESFALVGKWHFDNGVLKGGLEGRATHVQISSCYVFDHFWTNVVQTKNFVTVKVSNGGQIFLINFVNSRSIGHNVHLGVDACYYTNAVV